MNRLDLPRKLIELGDYEGAIEELKNSLRTNPRDLETWLLLAEAFPDKQNKHKCYEQILRLDPGNSSAIQALSYLDESPTQPNPTSLSSPDEKIIKTQSSVTKVSKETIQDPKKNRRLGYVLGGGSSFVILLALSYLLIVTIILPKVNFPFKTSSSSQQIPGPSSIYIPDANEMPPGYKADSENRGSIKLQVGDGYQALFANDSYIELDREANVLFISTLFSRPEDAKVMFTTLSDPTIYADKDYQIIPGIVNNQKIHADRTTLFFYIRQPTSSKRQIISCNLTFQIGNFVGLVITKAELHDPTYIEEMQQRLNETVYYYAYLMVRKLPIKNYEVVQIIFQEYLPIKKVTPNN